MADISRNYQLRADFFKRKGYEFTLPVGTEGRVKIISDLMDNLNPDYDAIVMLFDPTMDLEHADMLNLMGILYNDT